MHRVWHISLDLWGGGGGGGGGEGAAKGRASIQKHLYNCIIYNICTYVYIDILILILVLLLILVFLS